MTKKATRRKHPVIGVGSPAIIRLEEFGAWVFRALGHTAYLVGTAALGKTWRDVDVRVIVPNKEYDALFAEPKRWAFLCAAISALAQQQTGLPVDFQFQRQSDANLHYKGKLRYPLGTSALSWEKT